MNIQDLLNNAKDTLGLQPQETNAGVYIPSKSSLKLAAPNKTNYDHTEYDTPYTGNKKILMVCTEQQYMTMENGKKFETGNHPVEMMVPLLHFKKAGFNVDVFTPNGESVKVEQWAMPEEEDDVKQIYAEYQSKLENPKSIADFVKNDMADSDDYAAIFIPGGHGAMLGLPEDKSLGQLLRWSHDKDLFVLAICHGPAALLSANLSDVDTASKENETERDFIFKGYKMVAFPTAMDKQMPKIGYLPGTMPWYFGDKLEELGVTIDNKLASGQTHQDRKLISGDGPLAANEFGKLSAKELLKALK
ncbi:glyoxalase III HchA [Psychrobacter namhaensis]|jgi:D-lactate dehydratase / protein deglycase|uniref:glyoxalase III HchA n=1 Tax=Psychrobacter namhaensis TaxID=292734 RepID=UPI003FCF0462|tara:strand:- start:719 stop:1630 length:912 start_codon:yes stop_codon:yes gene_type:complete